MAAPHVAGAAAVLASNGLTPLEIDAYLKSTGNYDWFDDSGDGIQEPLLDLTGLTPRFVGGGPVTPPEPEPVNQDPVANFEFSCIGLTCGFDASPSSDDGTITGYGWQFGDGASSTGKTVNHTYAVAGSYAVQLTVSDNAGATADKTLNVVVETTSPPEPETYELVARSVNQGGSWVAEVRRSDGGLLSGAFNTGPPVPAKRPADHHNVRKWSA